MHAHGAFLSRMHRAQTTRQPPHRRTVARTDTWRRRERERRTNDEERRREEEERNEKGIVVARKGFNESCLLLAQIALRQRRKFPSHRPSLSPSSSFPGTHALSCGD